MSSLSPQRLLQIGKHLRIAPKVLAAAMGIASRIRSGSPDRAVIFTLRHLAALSGSPYPLLRDWVGRWGKEPYREFFLAKKADGRKSRKPAARARRRIAAPAPALLRQQRWLVERVLHHAPRHQASMAFHKRADIVEAAQLHCGSSWLIKMDVRDFFDSIHEPKVFNVFVKLGYPRLLAFELTRLCTRVIREDSHDGKINRRYALFDYFRGPHFYSRVRSHPNAAGFSSLALNDRVFERSVGASGSVRVLLPLGSLPQGAPTSPLLANLAVWDMDDRLTSTALSRDMVYTRYADDIALSTRRRDFKREDAIAVVHEVLREMELAGLKPHPNKTRIVPPSSRKIILGLAVDGTRPRLTRQYRNKLRLHAHMLGKRKIPPSAHAAALRFRSVLAMRRHIEGKLAHARRIEPSFAASIAAKIAAIDWTL